MHVGHQIGIEWLFMVLVKVYFFVFCVFAYRNDKLYSMNWKPNLIVNSANVLTLSANFFLDL